MKSTKYILPLLFATLLLDTISFGIVVPIIPSLFTDPQSVGFMLTGYSHEEQLFLAGLITAVFGLMQFLAAPLLGELSDVYGRKRLLALGVGILALSQLLFGAGIELGLLSLLFVARMVAGLAAANVSIAQAIIADVTKPEDRAKNFGLIGAAFGIGFIVGPLLSGWIAALSGNPAFAFWVASALGLINFIFVMVFLPETNMDPESTKRFTFLKGFRNILSAFRDKDARPLYGTSFFFFSGFAFFVSFIGILLVDDFDFTEAKVGNYFGIVGVSMFITQVFILRFLSKRYPENTTLPVTILLTALACFITPFAPSVLFLYLFIPLFAVPQGLTMANLPALISRGVSGKKQGAALGINASVMALAQGAVPLIAGSLAATIDAKAPFIMGSISMIIAWFILFTGRK